MMEADQLAVMERILSTMETRPLLLALTDSDLGLVLTEALLPDHSGDHSHAKPSIRVLAYLCILIGIKLASYMCCKM